MSNYKIEKRIEEVLESLRKSEVEEPPQIEYEVVNTSDIKEPWKFPKWSDRMRKIRKRSLRSGFHNLRLRKIKK